MDNEANVGISNAAAMQEMAELMDSRANVYKILSRAFRVEMDQRFASELAEDFIFESSNDQLTGALDAMRASLHGADGDAIEQMAVVFDRVFFGMGPITARHAFPYESVYTSEKGIMMQEAYSQVVRTYREQHLAKDASFTEPEDHIAVELAFMATLAERTSSFLREGLEEAAEQTVLQQAGFAKGHLLNWVDMFCADLSVAAQGSFYEHLAAFTVAFVKEDTALLDDLLDRSDSHED